MHLCTLHPSLSALALNLELNRYLSFGVLDAAVQTKIHLNQSDSQYFGPIASVDGQTSESFEVLSEEALLSRINSMDPGSLAFSSDYFFNRKQLEVLELPLMNADVKVSELKFNSLSQIVEFWDFLGKTFGKQARARDLHQRVEAQLMDWTSNFYARLRGKRVLVVSQFKPFVLASCWINDLIRRLGAIAPEIDADTDQVLVDWDFIAKFDPHIILFAPLGMTLQQSTQIFFDLQGLQAKELECFSDTPAAKRGDVYFCGGMSNFYGFDYRIIDTLGTLVSAIAGLDSGYITERDSFYKIRYLELHRHKFLKEA